LFRDVHDDLVEEIAGIEGIFASGLDEANDALGIGRDEQGEVVGGELREGCGRNDERWRAAKLLGRRFGWLWRCGLVGDGSGFCG
jgi:hypothetical protein